MLLAEIVEISARVGRTSSRLAKADALAACLRGAGSDEVGIAVTWLSARFGNRGSASAAGRSIRFVEHLSLPRRRR